MPLLKMDDLPDDPSEQQVRIDGGHVVINVVYDYAVPLDEVSTSDKILWWLVHLCEKTWITPSVLRRFAHLCANHHGLKID
jgi:hypothetical protein